MAGLRQWASGFEAADLMADKEIDEVSQLRSTSPWSQTSGRVEDRQSAPEVDEDGLTADDHGIAGSRARGRLPRSHRRAVSWGR
jgi:hypothetical protein